MARSPPVADLTPRIEKLVGRLAGGRGGGAGRPAGGSQPELRPGDAGFAEAVAPLVAMSLERYACEGARSRSGSQCLRKPSGSSPTSGSRTPWSGRG